MDAEHTFERVVGRENTHNAHEHTPSTFYEDTTIPTRVMGATVASDLRTLKEVHDFTGGVASMFDFFIALDLSSRENNPKTTLVEREVYAVAQSLSRLRMVSKDMQSADGRTLASRMKPIMTSLALDIQRCGCVCDVYTKEDILVRTLKATQYDACFLYALLSLRRNCVEFEEVMSDYIGITAQEHVQELDLRTSLRNSYTREEMEIQRILESRETGIEDDALLEELVEKTHRDLSSTPYSHGNRVDLAQVRHSLQHELREQVAVIVQRNLALLRFKFSFAPIHWDTPSLVPLTTPQVFFGVHSPNDPEVLDIWRSQGWKTLVGVDKFFSGLLDYFTKHLDPSDAWALKYIDISRRRPLLEAMGLSDGVFEVELKTVHTFAESRPSNWTLLQWFAFWSAGWHLSVTRYKFKIYILVRKMFRFQSSILPYNRRIFDFLLRTFFSLGMVLESTREVDDSIHNDKDLADLTDRYVQLEEKRLHTNLDALKYRVRGAGVVAAIAGAIHIEKHFYAILYLVIKHQLQYLTLASRHILHLHELRRHESSLGFILNAAHDRQNELLENTPTWSRQESAFGLFSGIWEFFMVGKNVAKDPFASWTHEAEVIDPDATIEISKLDVSTDVLLWSTQDVFETNIYDPPPEVIQPSEAHPICGRWTGHVFGCRNGEIGSMQGIIYFTLEVGEDGAIQGSGGSHSDDCDVSVSIQAGSAVNLTISFSNGNFICAGDFDMESQTITGVWSIKESTMQYPDVSDADLEVDEEDDFLDSISSLFDQVGEYATRGDDNSAWGRRAPLNTFVFSRASAASEAFRYTPAQLAESPARARWSFACNAVLHQVQKDLWSWSYLKKRGIDRRRFTHLTERAYPNRVPPHRRLSPAESLELRQLCRRVDPADARFWEALSEFQYEHQTRHDLISCDGCGFFLVLVRFTCLTCCTETFTNSTDFCTKCRAAGATESPFVHKQDHTLMKLNYMLTETDHAWLMPEARKMVGRVRAMYQARNVNQLGSPTREEDVGLAVKAAPFVHTLYATGKPLTCLYCLKPVSYPFLACVVCVSDTFICVECDEKQEDTHLVYNEHSLRHARIVVDKFRDDE